MKLSDRIMDAKARYAVAYPNGEWRKINAEFSSLFSEALPALIKADINPWAGGNEGRAAALRKIGL